MPTEGVGGAVAKRQHGAEVGLTGEIAPRSALLEQPSLRGAPGVTKSDYAGLLQHLFAASRYADLAADAHGRYTVLCEMATCLTSCVAVESPSEVAFPSPVWPSAADAAPRALVQMEARVAALTLLKELARAYEELAWLEKGGCYVEANIRGGGEFGPQWHSCAKKAHRNLPYEDFEAVAEDLIRTGVTTSPMLACRGGSNGGLLVSRQHARAPA